MPSEIAALPELTGYLKSGNDVVRMSFPDIDPPRKQEGFVARDTIDLYAPLKMSQGASEPGRQQIQKPVPKTIVQNQQGYFFE